MLEHVLRAALSASSDPQLVERFAETGDEAAFAVIVDRHGPMLLNLCRRVLDDAHLAEDVVQATFLVLARKAVSIRRHDSLASWLYGVAQRLARQARLAEVARRKRERSAAQARIEAQAADPSWEGLGRALDEELERLPERLRLPLLLCYLEGRTQDEAAKQLGWSLSTVRRRLEEGRELLRLRLTRRGAALGAGLLASAVAPSAVPAALSVELRRAIVALTSTNTASVPASVLALARGGMGITMLSKIALCSMVALFGGVAFEVMLQRPDAATNAGEPPVAARPAAPAAEPAIGLDRFNDPLPQGAVARLGTVPFRHGELALRDGSLTFTPDGKSLVSTGGGRIRRWDLPTRKATINLGDGWKGTLDHPGISLASADGKLARICTDKIQPGGGWECVEYNLETGAERTYYIEFPRNTDDSHAPPQILSPDGKTYAELNHAGKLTLWNAADGKVTHHLKPSGGAYTALAFLPDGKSVIVGDDTHTMRVLDLTTGQEQRSFGLFGGNAVHRMAVSSDGQWLATAGGAKAEPILPGDRFLRLWKVQEGSVARTLEFPEELAVASILFTPDSRTALAAIGPVSRRAVGPTVVRTWDVASGKPGESWTNDSAVGVTLAASPDGKTLAIMNKSGLIRLWDMASGLERRPLDINTASVESVSFQADGKTIVSVGADLVLRDWAAATGKPLGQPRRVMANSSPNPSFSCMLAPHGKYLLTRPVTGPTPRPFMRNDTGALRLHDSATGRLVLEKQGSWPVLAPDGKTLAFMNTDRVIELLDIASGRVLHTMKAPPPESDAVARGPSLRAVMADLSSLIFVGRALSVWDIRTGERRGSWSLSERMLLPQPPPPPKPPYDLIHSIAVSPDGRTIAFELMKMVVKDEYGNSDWVFQIMLVETATGKLLWQEDLGKDPPRHTVFSPDGKVVVRGGAWIIRLWNSATGIAIAQYDGHIGPIKALAFSADGQRLASASEDSTVLVWRVPR
jgi:RNA polymerase sigma factor (sigma-70 family)